MSELGHDEFGVIQSRNDVAMAGQVIRQECIASPADAAARMREKDDWVNSNRFGWTPDIAREAMVAGGVERLRAPLDNGESARDKWVIHQLVNDTTSLKTTLSPMHAVLASAGRDWLVNAQPVFLTQAPLTRSTSESATIRSVTRLAIFYWGILSSSQEATICPMSPIRTHAFRRTSG